MKRFRFLVEYDGTAYHGWQIQDSVVTVQGVLNKFLEQVLRHPVVSRGASRTDAGVHAKGQVVSFQTDKPITCDRLFAAMRGLLPHDISVMSVDEVPLAFNPRFDAIKKQYSYRICNRRQMSVFLRPYCHHVRRDLNLDLMQEVLPLILGTHNFQAFSCNDKKDHITFDRTLHSAHFEVDRDEGTITFIVCGDAFLYKMVRLLVSALIQVGLGGITKLDINDMFATGRRHSRLDVAPAKGLFLDKVFY